ncbi:MAG: hypothetical protein ACOX8B_05730 [Lachnospiraceae bacterium]
MKGTMTPGRNVSLIRGGAGTRRKERHHDARRRWYIQQTNVCRFAAAPEYAEKSVTLARGGVGTFGRRMYAGSRLRRNILEKLLFGYMGYREIRRPFIR